MSRSLPAERLLKARPLYLFGFGTFGAVMLLSLGVVLLAGWNGEFGPALKDHLLLVAAALWLGWSAVWAFQVAASRLVLGDGWIEVALSPFSFRRGRLRGADVDWISGVVDTRMPQVVVHLRSGRRWFVLLDVYGPPAEIRQAVIEALGVPEAVHQVKP